MRFAARHRSGLLGLVLASLLLPTMATAEEQLYDVELIIFRHTEATSQQAGERWPRVPEPARYAHYAELSSGNSVDAGTFRQLATDMLQLGNVAQRLERSGSYTVLLHAAWRQPGLGNADAAAVPLPLGSRPEQPDDPVETERPIGEALMPERPPVGLSGYVRVYRERFLHAEVDLRYLREQRDEAESQRAALPLFDDMEPVVVMQERRRMRSGELHHIDHPVIGALIRVTPVD